MGQTDVVKDKTGEGCFTMLIKLLDDVDKDLFKHICFCCTDGASAMRSTPFYAGLDGKSDGSSLHAHMKRAGKPLLPNLHCLCHQLNLALKLAINNSGAWSKQWQDHLKAVFNWFKKSPSRKAKLKALHKQMQLLRDVVTWRFVYPKYYCPTRWLGILRAVKSINASSDLLVEYAETLQEEGLRPDRGNPDDPPIEYEDATLDLEEDYHTERHHEASFYQWGSDPWDLDVINRW